LNVILLAVYAVFVWYLAARYRRRWQGVAAVFLGVLAIWMVVSLLKAGDGRTGGAVRSHQLLTLLWAEMIIVAGIGLFLVCLPRRRGELDCPQCGYDLTGLDPQGLKCPECGRPWTGLGSGLANDRSARTFTPIPSTPRRQTKGL
jgi:cytochrome c biogenesis protein CcdA